MARVDESRWAGAGAFATTHWSVVLAAKETDPAVADAALEKLCHTYWPPLYAFIRREGHAPEDARDLTQEFLSRFVHREWLSHLRDRRGKFRSFLLTFLRHFLADQRDRARAQKRGGGQSFVSLEAFADEERHGVEPIDGLTADQLYERRWAQTVMTTAAQQLAEEYRRRGRADVYAHIKDVHPGEHGERSYAQIGAALGMTEQAVKCAVHDFRRRYGALVREEIARTVADPAEVAEEVKHLMQIFSRA